MKEQTSALTHRLSYQFRQNEHAVYLKSVVEISTPPHVSYSKNPVQGQGIFFEVIYNEIAVNDSAAGIFPDTELIKTEIKVPDMDEYNPENLMPEIRNYLRSFGENAKFQVKVRFNNPDGSDHKSTFTGICDDADIEID